MKDPQDFGFAILDFGLRPGVSGPQLETASQQTGEAESSIQDANPEAASYVDQARTVIQNQKSKMASSLQSKIQKRQAKIRLAPGLQSQIQNRKSKMGGPQSKIDNRQSKIPRTLPPRPPRASLARKREATSKRLRAQSKIQNQKSKMASVLTSGRRRGWRRHSPTWTRPAPLPRRRSIGRARSAKPPIAPIWPRRTLPATRNGRRWSTAWT